jgi:hypothetical protein
VRQLWQRWLVVFANCRTSIKMLRLFKQAIHRPEHRVHVGRRFDDVVRITAAPPETKRTTVELDDKKSQQVGRRLLMHVHAHAAI